MTTTVWPCSTRLSRTCRSGSTSSRCSPVVGSSSTYVVDCAACLDGPVCPDGRVCPDGPVCLDGRDAPNSSAIFTRWDSPPDSEFRDWPRRRYPLPARLRPWASSLRAGLETSPQWAPRVTAERLAVVAEAVARRETITFVYTDARGERTGRRVEPCRLVHHLLRWYLLGWDCRREDWRVFRFDRLDDLLPTGVHHTPRPFPAESATDYLRQGLHKDREPVQLLVEASAVDVVDALKFQDAQVHSEDDRHTRVGLAVGSWQWLVLQLAFLDADFRILAGTRFARDCRAFGERLLAATSEDEGQPQTRGAEETRPPTGPPN
ncbi:helix-turn-helix transcriptional regulator [Streptomyces sp. NPDC002328]|uniref:helix-turn-helix transcriptional regulator n=1 Tax=Streptomyces sp. NPDC002328 TaxID=3364642 RepID=UPI00367C1655